MQPFALSDRDPQVVVVGHRLDAHLVHPPGCFEDGHPNLAGYHMIGNETAEFMVPHLRAKCSATKPWP